VKKAALASIFIFTLAGVLAQSKPTAMRYGMLFSVNGITLEDCQGGVGVAVIMNPMKLRTSADIRYKDSNINPDELDIGLTGVFEYHLRKGKVSPYIGAFAGYRYEQDKNTVNADNWTKAVDHIIGAGPLVGVEFFILDNVSLFAEYEFAILMTKPSTSVCTSGTVTRTPEDMEFLFDARLGNGAKLGITVYF
jgi:hypothetical protein